MRRAMGAFLVVFVFWFVAFCVPFFLCFLCFCRAWLWQRGKKRGTFLPFLFREGTEDRRREEKVEKKKLLAVWERKKNSNRSLFLILLKKHDTLKGTQRTLYEKYAFTLNTKWTRDGQIPSARRLCSSRDSFGSFFKRFRGERLRKNSVISESEFFLYNCL